MTRQDVHPARRRGNPICTALALGLLCVVSSAWAAIAAEVEHPYILWTRDEAKMLRDRILSSQWSKEQFVQTFEKVTNAMERSTFDNMFLYTMTGDKDAADAEMQALMEFVNAPPKVKDSFDWQWHHANHSDMAVRYDVFYHELTPPQRRVLEQTFREFATFGIEGEPLRGFAYSRMLSHIFAALALRDKRLIKGIFECQGSIKDLFDGMQDGHFVGGANPQIKQLGEFWLWCRAVERLGMNEIGFGYTGKSGGTMRGLLEGYMLLCDPAIDVPGGKPFHGRAAKAMLGGGDGSFFDYPMPHPRDVFGLPLVIGRLRNGGGGWPFHFGGPKNYWPFTQGSFKLLPPLVFELAHQKWPDARFDYVLTRFAISKSDKYVPSIYWGLDPIDCAKPKPLPIKSEVYKSLNAALLRAEEGEGYWTSPAPYAVMGLGGAGSRGGSRALTLYTLHAFNRPIYRELPGVGSMDPLVSWFTTGKPFCTVVVDNQRMGTGDGPIRRHFNGLVKFVGNRVAPNTWLSEGSDKNVITNFSALYPGVQAERCLMLTREYLFDVFQLTGDRPHTYDWIANALGSAEPDDPSAWKPTTALDASLGSTHGGLAYSYIDQRAHDAKGQTWSLNAVQTAMTTNTAATVMGPEWYGRHIGVRVSMLGAPDTTAFFSRKPLARSYTEEENRKMELIRHPYRLLSRDQKYDKEDQQITEVPLAPPDGAQLKDADTRKPKEDFKPVGIITEKLPEAGGVTIVAERRGTNATFVALHEPFEQRRWKIGEFRRIQQTDDAVAVAVRGKDDSPVNDRIMLRLGGDAEKPVSLADDAESFRFSDFAYLRVTADKVLACGKLHSMKLKVGGSPKLVLNGEEKKAELKNGILSYEE